MAWLRMHDGMLDNPKIQMLSDREFRMLINLWALAKRYKGKIPGDIKRIAFALRLSGALARTTLEALITAKLINKTEDGYEPHDWKEHQYEGDGSNERVNKYRRKMRSHGETVGGYLKHKAAVFERDGNCCVYCGRTERLVLDHVVPVANGGKGDIWNLVAACKECNSAKGGRDPVTAKMSFCHARFEQFCHAAIQTVTMTERDCHGDSNGTRQQTTEYRKQITDNNNNRLNTASASEEFVVVVDLLNDFKTLPEKKRRAWGREFQDLREKFAFSELRQAAEQAAAQGARITSLNYLVSLIEGSGNGEPRPNGKEREADEAARRALQAEMKRVSPSPPDYSFLAGDDVAH